VRVHADRPVEHLAAPHVKSRTLDPDPSSASTYRRIAKWLDECTSSHSKCKSSKSPKLPSRMTTRCLWWAASSHYRPRGDWYLCRIELLLGFFSNGDDDGEKLRSAQQRIKESSLLLTIRDAIHVTRCLGVRFLWVDALCIVQDSINGEDWHRECSAMSNVYSNAFLTISADSAKDSAKGFLNRRSDWGANPSLRRPYYLETRQECGSVYFLHGDLDDRYDKSWLSTRAWAFQERRLSRRVLDYRPRQISLSCKSGVYKKISSKLSGFVTF
jgi:hypothetical protein